MPPITFFATAFGLMMEKVRSIAMITSLYMLFCFADETDKYGANYNHHLRRLPMCLGNIFLKKSDLKQQIRLIQASSVYCTVKLAATICPASSITTS